ncbi:ABC transporter ATP-binding protein [Catenovulum sp. 2E275]|uniref:ABC transporter ATP-binding protein n=1 Tax=Catenovulum sp. 2E275 TaxID=2980497 RepID=UPI0021D28CA4|nr:ABC transporter ATP-binding protein [Catenovulum sp. 2E275]MCU4676808.1 ABC transporter ATP-binding protein [Catenovulum sp. 2E275]
MIQVNKLSKQFGQTIAVDHLCMEVKKGDIVGVLGINGAGKSTTIKMLAGFIKPSSGSIEINGLNMQKDAIKIKRLIGYLPETAPSYEEMTVAQFLNFIAQVRQLKKQDQKKQLNKIVEQLTLVNVLNQKIATLSAGFKRKVGLAQALLHDPEVLILDEPMVGLDPNQKHQVRQLIQRLSPDKAIIIATNILEEIITVCNRIVIINKGQKVFDGTSQQFALKGSSKNTIVLEFKSKKPDVSHLRLAPGVVDIIDLGERKISIVGHESYDNLFPQIFDTVHLQGWDINAIYAEESSMEEIFKKITVGN